MQTGTIVQKWKAKSVPMVVLQWLNQWKSFKSKSLLISIDNIPSQQIEGNYTIMTQFLQTTSSVHAHGTISYNFKWIFSIWPSCWTKPVLHACNLTGIYQKRKPSYIQISTTPKQVHEQQFQCHNEIRLTYRSSHILFFQEVPRATQWFQSDHSQQFTSLWSSHN